MLDPSEPLFRDVPHETIVWMSHGDQLHDAGADFLPLATTATCPIAAVRHHELPIYGLQFHPEVSHTPYGSLILGNFLDRICRNPRTWTMEAFIERSLSEINRRVGPDRAGCLRLIRRGRLGGLRGPPGQGARAAGGLRVRRYRAACGKASARRLPRRSAREPAPSFE